MSTDMVRWTVSVSRETDIAVRGFLAQHGMKKGDLSRFMGSRHESVFYVRLE